MATIACFSFHPRKIITTGDGGMIVTANGDWDRKFRLWRQHGMRRSGPRPPQLREVLFESYPALGYNYRRRTSRRPSGGTAQTPARDHRRRRSLADRYRSLAGAIDGVGLPAEPHWARSNWQSFCVSLDATCQQRTVMQFLLDRGIATRRGIMCSHREPAYAGEPWKCESSDSPAANSLRNTPSFCPCITR